MFLPSMNSMEGVFLKVLAKAIPMRYNEENS